MDTLTSFLSYLNQLHKPMPNLCSLRGLATGVTAGTECIQDVSPHAPEAFARAVPNRSSKRPNGGITHDH